MKNKAFTLAEVLIVLALVGFLFTLTIPNVIHKQGSQKYIETLTTAQSKLQTAFEETAKANNNKLPLDWDNVKASNNKSEAIIKELGKRLQIMSYCGTSDSGCFAPNGYRTLNGVATTVITDDMEPFARTSQLPQDDIVANDNVGLNLQDESESNSEQPMQKPVQYHQADPKASSVYVSLLDGGSIALKTSSTYCNGIVPAVDPIERPFCGVIYVDVNGPAIPNMLGVDVFGFYLSGNNVLPMGFYGDDFSFDYNCLRETPRATKYNGLGCTAWAMKNKNMEYRKCQAGKRLGWASATRCTEPSKK